MRFDWGSTCAFLQNEKFFYCVTWVASRCRRCLCQKNKTPARPSLVLLSCCYLLLRVLSLVAHITILPFVVVLFSQNIFLLPSSTFPKIAKQAVEYSQIQLITIRLVSLYYDTPLTHKASKMDSPNLQRRNTIRLDPRRRCLLLRAHRSNPHIGWSRHVPDSSYLTIHTNPTSRAYRGSLKSSPYVGWFRHAPATVTVFTKNNRAREEFYERQARKWLQEEIRFFLEAMPSSKVKHYDGVRCLQELVDPRLVGGNDRYGQTMTSHPHGSLKVLQNLKAWLFLPFQEDESSVQSSWNIKSIEQDQMTLDDEASDGDSDSEDEQEQEEVDDDEYSNYSYSEDPTTSETDNYGKNTFDIGISSQAEAYYAHQVTSELALNPDDHAGILPSPSSSRLDYVITQMDIVRMHRNASRHLDVESIYKLPTITYEAPKLPRDATTKTASRTGEKSAEGWSWMFVPKDNKTIEESLILEEESLHGHADTDDSNVCVICMDSFVDGDRLRVLPCSHSFHVACIDKWLSGSSSFDDCHTAGCPTCKKRADTGLDMDRLDGSVPSWAFAQLGRSLARECSDC